MDLDTSVGFGRLSKIYNEAIKANCFIYNKEDKEWFTPERFKEKYQKENLSHSLINGLLEELVIRDPIAGINAAHKQILDRIERLNTDIEKDLIKLTDFAKMTIHYQQGKIKK